LKTRQRHEAYVLMGQIFALLTVQTYTHTYVEWHSTVTGWLVFISAIMSRDWY